MRVMRLKESYPTAKVEHVVRGRGPFGFEADRAQGIWSPIGRRPLVKVHQRYEWTYLYAFAHPKSGKVHWLILPTVKAEVFSMALEHFAQGKWERERENASCSWSIGPDGTRQRRS